MHDGIGGISVSGNGLCNLCDDHHPFVPYGEEALLKILSKAQKKKRTYDALVPLSGGKDSTYVLHLAVNKYKLRTLTYSFDNGFMSEPARRNIEKAVEICHVDHIWVKHGADLISRLYKTALLESGEICGLCGVGIERSMLKLSEAWRIPIILMGHSPTESNSFTSENIYDVKRLKYILNRDKQITPDMIRRFLVYPNLNFLSTWFLTRTGKFGRKVNILYYTESLTDNRIGEILKKEMGWTEPAHSEYTRHFDCLAEPFTNYIREKRFGFSRRLPQLSNMIRSGEMSREKALQIADDDTRRMSAPDFGVLKDILNLTDDDIEKTTRVPLNLYSDKTDPGNKIFAFIRTLIKGNTH